MASAVEITSTYADPYLTVEVDKKLIEGSGSNTG
jgi:hypothetical protein